MANLFTNSCWMDGVRSFEIGISLKLLPTTLAMNAVIMHIASGTLKSYKWIHLEIKIWTSFWQF